MLSREERQHVKKVIGDLMVHPVALEMKKYIQHGDVSTYDHALAVCYRAYEMAKKRLNRLDERALLRAAFLHDLYLYDWHDPDPSHKWHGFHHARRAANNAVRIFGVSELERRIIDSHMWPLNPERIPHCREGWILTLSDKWVSTLETITRGSVLPPEDRETDATVQNTTSAYQEPTEG